MELVESSARVAKAGLAAPTGGVGPDSGRLLKMWVEAAAHFARPSEAVHETIEEELQRLASEWREATTHMSSLSDMVSHHAYQRIIGKGRVAVPFLLQSLQSRPEHWFAALTSITGVNPVARGDEGRVRKMAQAWLTWGREQGII